MLKTVLQRPWLVSVLSTFVFLIMQGYVASWFWQVGLAEVGLLYGSASFFLVIIKNMPYIPWATPVERTAKSYVFLLMGSFLACALLAMPEMYNGQFYLVRLFLFVEISTLLFPYVLLMYVEDRQLQHSTESSSKCSATIAWEQLVLFLAVITMIAASFVIGLLPIFVYSLIIFALTEFLQLLLLLLKRGTCHRFLLVNRMKVFVLSLLVICYSYHLIGLEQTAEGFAMIFFLALYIAVLFLKRVVIKQEIATVEV